MKSKSEFSNYEVLGVENFRPGTLCICGGRHPSTMLWRTPPFLFIRWVHTLIPPFIAPLLSSAVFIDRLNPVLRG